MEQRRLKYFIIYCAALLIGAASVLTWNIYRLVNKPMIKSGSAPVIIYLNQQTSANQFIQALKTRGLIKSGKLLRTLIRFHDYSHQLKAGIYRIEPGESAPHFLYRVIAGDVLTETFSIIEGTTQSSLGKKLQQAPYLNYNPADWQKIAGAYSSAEGLLLADTYQYQAGSGSYSLLRQANYHLIQYLEKTWQQRSQNLPYKTPYQLLIAASIIEKETSIPEERKLISGVMINRLRKRMPLQMDPTVIYALGDNYTGKLTHANLGVDSPFNTYRYRGLPPTPIAMVGKNSIDAAAHPEVTNYLYFVAKGDGSHQFSETYEQQKKAISRYQIKEN